VLPLAGLWMLGHSEGALRFGHLDDPVRFATLEHFSIRDVRGTLPMVYVGAIDIEHDIVHVHIRGVRTRVDLLPLLGSRWRLES
jgi:hypothetical protein